MTCEGDFQLACDQVPELDCAIITTGDEEAIERVDSKTSNPAIVTGDDRLQLPWCVPLGLNYFAITEYNLVAIQRQSFL